MKYNPHKHARVEIPTSALAAIEPSAYLNIAFESLLSTLLPLQFLKPSLHEEHGALHQAFSSDGIYGDPTATWITAIERLIFQR
jgi:hypothetical protein